MCHRSKLSKQHSTDLYRTVPPELETGVKPHAKSRDLDFTHQHQPCLRGWRGCIAWELNHEGKACTAYTRSRKGWELFRGLKSFTDSVCGLRSTTFKSCCEFGAVGRMLLPWTAAGLLKNCKKIKRPKFSKNQSPVIYLYDKM